MPCTKTIAPPSQPPSVRRAKPINVSAYALRSYNLAAFAGQTVTIKFTGVEDASLQTSFVIDDTALTVS